MSEKVLVDRSLLENVLRVLEEQETTIENEFGLCQSLEELEEKGLLTQEILDLRVVLKRRS